MDFISNHAGAVASIMSALVALVGFLLLTLFRLYTRNNDERQLRQDERISDLEKRLEHFSGDHNSFGTHIEHLHETLKRMLQELKREREERRSELAQERLDRKQAEAENRTDHKEIKDDLKGIYRRVAGEASA